MVEAVPVAAPLQWLCTAVLLKAQQIISIPLLYLNGKLLNEINHKSRAVTAVSSSVSKIQVFFNLEELCKRAEGKTEIKSVILSICSLMKADSKNPTAD